MSSLYFCFTEILLPHSCDYFYLVIAKIKIIHFWIFLQASDNCQHAPEYILQMGFFFLNYFQDIFQVKTVTVMTLTEWWWFLSQCGLPAWELYSSWNEEKWGKVDYTVIIFHQLIFAFRLHDPSVVGLFVLYGFFIVIQPLWKLKSLIPSTLPPSLFKSISSISQVYLAATFLLIVLSVT